LLVASRTATESHQKFAITSPSPALSDVCVDLGLTEWLKQWSRA